jgi:Zn-dependent M28 family amino/carboxypeptidase
VDSFAIPDSEQVSPAATLRWVTIAVLMAGALGLYLSASRGEDIRGAVHNASGVAALLGLAEKFAARPMEEADVWIAATGCHETWMAGMRHLLADPAIDRKRTWILNLEGVGAGSLHYLKTEGFMHTLHADKTLASLADTLRVGRPVQAGNLRAIPTAAHVPLMRGMKAMTLMGLDRDGLPPHWNQPTDRISEVDETGVAETIEFSELLLRALARSQAGESPAADNKG